MNFVFFPDFRMCVCIDIMRHFEAGIQIQTQASFVSRVYHVHVSHSDIIQHFSTCTLATTPKIRCETSAVMSGLKTLRAWGLERWLSQKHLLLLHRTRVQIPAPTLDTAAPSSGCCRHLYSAVHTYTCTFIQLKNHFKKFESLKEWEFPTRDTQPVELCKNVKESLSL